MTTLFGTEPEPSNYSLERSPLPTYEAERLELTLDGRVVNARQVTCKRCKNWFIVDARKWAAASRYESRPCPHCFKVSKLPPRRRRDAEQRK